MAKTRVSTKKKKQTKKNTAKLTKNCYRHATDFHSCYTEEAWSWINSTEDFSKGLKNE